MSGKAAETIVNYRGSVLPRTIRNNDSARDLPETEPPVYGMAYEAAPSAKRHAACDECRKRKLKCSGEPTGCSKCLKQYLTCHYSVQKQMGRPRKKLKLGQEADPTAEQVARDEIYSQSVFEATCPGPITQWVKNYTLLPQPGHVLLDTYRTDSIGTASEVTLSSEIPNIPPTAAGEIAYPVDMAAWPDFSDMTSLPMPVQDSHLELDGAGSPNLHHPHHSGAPPESLNHLPGIPACPCLPNLYLTLSTLATLACFPITLHTIETLQTAARTGYSVLYCRICPNKFQSGIQNVMLLGTLFTVLGDAWHRVRKATPEEFRRGFFSPPGTDAETIESPMTEWQQLEWRTFAHQLLRANVFGDHPTPCPPSSLSPILSREQQVDCHNLRNTNSGPTPTLISLVDAMERRHHFWHNEIPDTGEFASAVTQSTRSAHLEGISTAEIGELNHPVGLCVTVAERTRSVIETLDYPAPSLL